MIYRVIASRLRIPRTGLPRLDVTRPQSNGEFTDLEEPTLVDIDDTCLVDVPLLLKQGGIVEYTPPAEKKGRPYTFSSPPVAEEGVPIGETE